MDSITQITLGAAVAEVVAGKKLGNRAILWGAVAGTIPDMDVFANFFLKEINALAFHRGFTHSFVFAILGAFIFSWLVQGLYSSKYYRYLGAVGWSVFPLLIFILFNRSIFLGDVNLMGLLISFLFLLLCFFFIYRRYGKSGPALPEVSISTWRKLFFWSIVTHPILDSFTTYGTQLFQPISDFRVGFNNISVVDPLYTIPFLVCVIVMSLYSRESRIRRIVNYLGIVISSIYLVFTLYHKYRVNNVMEKTLVAEGIEYNRFMTSPTILNNILWSGCAETDSSMYLGQFSFYDKEKKFKLIELPKNHDWLENNTNDRSIQILKWFSNGYYNVIKREDGKLQINDLRYGRVQDPATKAQDFVFKFVLEMDEHGEYQVSESEGGPPEGEEKEMLRVLIKRIKGI